MIYCTSAPNDADLVAALGSLAVVAPIPHGDCVFFGVGEETTDIRVLVERKKIGDMANSILDGRYLSQAQAAHDAGFNHLILIVEGVMRPGRSHGLIEVPRGAGWSAMMPNISYSRFDAYVDELALYTGITVKRSASVSETAAQVKVLWQLFQKPPSAHQSLHQIYSAPPPSVQLSKPSLVRRVAKELPGVGWERSLSVDRAFRSVIELANAGEQDWKSIEGIGPKTAKTIVAAVRSIRPIKE